MASARGDVGEAVFTRWLDAPRALVFRMWTEQAHLVRWWRPKGFQTPGIERLDVREGGGFQIRMRHMEGSVYLCRGEYGEIREPEGLEYHELCDEDGKLFHEARVRVELIEEKGGTRLTIRAKFIFVPGRDARWTEQRMREGWTEGWASNVDLMEMQLKGLVRMEVLERRAMASGPGSGADEREIVLQRVVDAPRERVFRAWTNPKEIANWWGPRGFATTVHEMDVREGGVWRFTIHGPDGVNYENSVHYIEVVRPERLVYTHAGAESDPAPPFHVTVTFETLGRRTNLTLRSLFATKAERDRTVEFGAVESGMQMLEKLAEFLKRPG